MKRLLPTLALILSATLPLTAQQAAPPTNQPSTRDQLIEALMTAPDDAALATAIAEGKKGGLPEQMFLEARFISLINKEDTAGLAALAPQLEAQLSNYTTNNTMIFAVKEDFESVIHYTKALGALQKNDTPTFKKHITEAYWLSPKHGATFAPHITEVRLKEAMAKLTLDLKRTFVDQKVSNKMTSLKEVAGQAPAFLIHFWSPWVQQSIIAMPEFNAIAKILTAHKIPVTSVLLAGTSESQQEAFAYLEENKDNTLGHWLIDTNQSSLASSLRIANFPTVVLVKQDGSIIFNGDPASKNFWDALAFIDPTIETPTTNPVLPKANTQDASPSNEKKE